MSGLLLDRIRDWRGRSGRDRLLASAPPPPPEPEIPRGESETVQGRPGNVVTMRPATNGRPRPPRPVILRHVVPDMDYRCPGCGQVVPAVRLVYQVLLHPDDTTEVYRCFGCLFPEARARAARARKRWGR